MADGMFGPGIFGTGIDLSALDEGTAWKLGVFMGEQIRAAEARGRVAAEAELQASRGDRDAMAAEAQRLEAELATMTHDRDYFADWAANLADTEDALRVAGNALAGIARHPEAVARWREVAGDDS